ncbi:uncharacterized protein [Gossypium hirsutum]|uniref:Uncharacterized protein isoform X3 n=1 Tax=Gossypium hirsutum TaxID=3635 RepID=A0ABM2Z952_GOSHI|nr:uncharacterized protein LOC107923867 isoform X3 [Gossypium hirsutum]XP_040938718.1 uncharacterized protein LOC107923867 isoform X3 [Gossypium hirsutum]
MVDKSWMDAPRFSTNHLAGIERFLSFATGKSLFNGKIYCPCHCCNNRILHEPYIVGEHLRLHGIIKEYKHWIFHGESIERTSVQTDQTVRTFPSICTLSQDNEADLRDLITDALGINIPTLNESFDGVSSEFQNNGQEYDVNEAERTKEKAATFQDNCDISLYPGCVKFSCVSFLLRLYLFKALFGWSAKSLTCLLEFLNEAFPDGNTIPITYYEAKKKISALNLGYVKIDACPNDCMLYWGDASKKISCDVCKSSKWQSSSELDADEQVDGSCRHPKPAKVLRYFPLIPRLKRLFQSSKTSQSMRWHKEGRTKDGILRHPVDGSAWDAFDKRFPDFASDPRNVRLGLASDGFNPFRTMSTSHSTWPVLLIPYNLEPWACMKQLSMILSMVIPGEKGPGNDIDVYMQPLIKELKQLWTGVDAFDSSASESFTLRACLLWTINDFLAYANLSRWSTKGRVACPVCAEKTKSLWLRYGRKFCYMGHRRWLSAEHPFQKQSREFDGTIEYGVAPIPRSGEDILREVEGVNFIYGKARKRDKEELDEGSVELDVDEGCDLFNNFEELVAEGDEANLINQDETLWKKRSIFFDLPYWRYNLLRHNLDVMHIEKNVCDNVIGTLLNLSRGGKDNIKARKDLQDMGIQSYLHPKMRDGKEYLPQACYTLASRERDIFLSIVKNLKVPDGYASNISRCVNLKEHKLSNLKSHDCHILIQDLLPICLRGVVEKNVLSVITNLSDFFKRLCAKSLDPQEVDQLQIQVMLTLCEMEKIFPPSFFTIMIHLIIHLPMEAKLGGPVQYRWMYPIERYLMGLKASVRNRAYPEGSIAEGYIVSECLTFCSRYFSDVETIFSRPLRNDGNIQKWYIFSSGGRPIGTINTKILDMRYLTQANRYVLLHSDKLSPYRQEFLESERAVYGGIQISKCTEDKWLVEKFPRWLANRFQR